MLLKTDHAKAATELNAQDIHHLDKIEINQRAAFCNLFTKPVWSIQGQINQVFY